MNATPARPPETAARALAALEALLAEQRAALVAGDLAAIDATTGRLHALLADTGWRRDLPRATPALRRRLRAALLAAGVNAGAAARGESHAARSLAAIGTTPGLYTAAGAWGRGAAPGRGVAA